MLPDQRRGFWAAIARGLLALVGTLVSPLVIFYAVLTFALAWGIRRGQMWAAIAGTAFLLIPLPLMIWNRSDDMVAPLVIAVLIELIFAWFFARAALALGRAGAAASGHRIWIGAIVLFAAFWVGFQTYSMPSASMQDTILLNDAVLVRTLWSRVSNGDIIVFHYPPDTRQIFVKRVVGCPGDRVKIVNKQLYRNGIPVVEPYTRTVDSALVRYRDNFPSPPDINLPALGADMLARNVRDGEVIVPDGKYFVLGDNRDDSLDSRYWGFVSRHQIIGKPILVYASYELGRTPETATRTVLNTRWNRLLKPL